MLVRMSWRDATNSPSSFELAQNVLQSRTSVHLEPQDIALLILIRGEIDEQKQGIIAVDMDLLRGFQARIDFIANADQRSAERRLSESIGCSNVCQGIL